MIDSSSSPIRALDWHDAILSVGTHDNSPHQDTSGTIWGKASNIIQSLEWCNLILLNCIFLKIRQELGNFVFVRVFSSLQNKPTCWNCSSKKPNFKVPTLSQYKMSCFPLRLWIPPFVWRSFHHKFHCNSKLLSLTKHFRESGQAILFVRQTEFHSLTTDSAISKPWIVNCISLKGEI